MKFQAILFSLGLILAEFVNAQTGTVRGKVFDGETGEPIFIAQVVLEGTSNGASTDLDGNFEFNAPPGLYTLNVSFLGMAQTSITGVEIIADETATFNNIKLMPASQTLETFEVTAEVSKRSETALLTIKKKSANVLDGISSQTFSKIGDGDAAEAVTRVPGVSITDGKYVYVRGLGDRYTKTTLNGMDIPGLDPDRNSIQLDLFPTNIIDNIVVLKSFTADLPADFTGGVVNIETKEFPTEPTLSVSAGVTYTEQMHFNGDFNTYEGGNSDFLGFDDGTRDLPYSINQDFPSVADVDPQLTALTQELNPTLAADQTTSPMNFSFGVSGGNQYKKEKATFGLNAALSYKNNTTFFEDREQNFFVKPDDLNEYQLRADVRQIGDLGVNNVLVSGLLGGAIKTERSKISINLMHLQNGENRAGVYFEEQSVNNVVEIFRDNLEYSQRSVSNAIVSGEHALANPNWKIEWKVSPTLSNLQDKDVRVTPYRLDDNGFSIEPSEAGNPLRIWRNLDEFNVASRLDFINDHSLLSYNAKLKFGFGYVYKQRDYEILDYQLIIQQRGTFSFTGDANEILFDENLYQTQTNRGTYVQGNFIPSNTYDGTQTTFSAYISEEFQIAKKLKSIVGVRMEKYDQFYTGENQQAANDPNAPGAISFDNEKILDLLDFFPTASLIYSIDDNTNLRGSFYRTTARPSFKEVSIAQIPDVITSITFIGNIELEPAYINNYDIRFEKYFQSNQLFSISGFYKQFSNPIEVVAFNDAAPDNFQPRNVGDAEVFGLELELRKNLAFIGTRFEDFSFNINASIIESRVEFDRSPNGEFESRTNNLRTDESGNPIETIGDTRDMQGQAPYLINAGLSYNNREAGLTAGVYYNVQGRKLLYVGIGPNPDVFTVPFHSMNFNMIKSFGEEDQFSISFGVTNLLDDAQESEYESFNSSNEIFYRFFPRRSWNIGLRYRIK